MPRPSGIRHSPRRASSSGRAPLTRRPGDEHVARASAGAARPRPAGSSTCPAPFGPSSATTLASGHRRGRRRAGRRCRRSRRGCRAARAAARPARRRPARARGRRLRAEVGGEHRFVRAGSPPACPMAMIWPKSSTWTSSQTSITSCTSCSTSTTADALAGELAQQLAELLGLGLVLARRRLVEQQHLRLASRAHRPSSTSRHWPVGSDVDALVGDVARARRAR